VSSAPAPAPVTDPSGLPTTSAALPDTGQNTTLPLMMGIFLVLAGVVLLGAARRRQQIERLLWPDER